MAIKVSLESTKIPVEIGDLKFEIDVTDEKYEAFIEKFNNFLAKIEFLSEEKVEDMTLLKTMVSEVYEELLGMGSYEKIYSKMPNIGFVSSALVSIVTQLIKEMEQRITATSKMNTVTKKK